MKASRIHAWYLVHKWTSLACTLFLLVICITGLPLVFLGEINDVVLPSRDASPVQPGDTRAVSVDRFIATGRERFPGQIVTGMFVDDDEPQAFVSMAPSFEAAKANPKLYHWLKFDTRTGEVINTSEQFQRDMKAGPASAVNTFMGVMLRLHVDLYARLPGQLFLAFMALLFITAIISGIVLYSPFMKKLPFGTVRAERSSRLKWLDMHNLLGIVTLTWVLVVGATGAINEIAGPLSRLWMNTDVQAAWAPWRGHTPPRQNEMASVQAAFDTARRALPGMVVTSLSFPRPDSGSAYHYLLWADGSTPQTERLSTAVLIDARTGQLTKVLEMPWYLRTLEVSRPLHFGDYGGLPLKILWVLLDVLTIIVLGSGLYLWIARRKTQATRLERIVAAHEAVHHALPRLETRS